MSKIKDREAYVKQYPSIKNWLNKCLICVALGYKPELPIRIQAGYIAENIRRLFSPLQVDELHICRDCARYWNKESELMQAF